MFDVRSRWRPWAGAGAASVIAEYADAKGSPVTGTLTNGELVALGAVVADALSVGGPRWNPYVQGSGAWGAGSLIGSLARSRITGSGTPNPSPKASGGAPAGGGSSAASPSGTDSYIPSLSYGVSADGGY